MAPPLNPSSTLFFPARNLLATLLLGLLAAGCGDSDATGQTSGTAPGTSATPRASPGTGPAAGGASASGPSPGTASATALTSVDWIELEKTPDIEGLAFPEQVLTEYRLIVVALPLSDFPTQTQGDRTYRHAIFHDWSLQRSVNATGAAGIESVVCLAAVSGTSGQLSIARQRNFKTGKTELADASLGGDAKAFYLLFQMPRNPPDLADAPLVARYQGKPVHALAAAARAELINQLFLPAPAPGLWVNDVLDLGAHPLLLGDFGTLEKLVRRTELVHTDPKGEVTRLTADPGQRFIECHFGPKPGSFDYRAADWHLTLADSSSFAAYGLSVNGGQGYYVKLVEGKGFAGQPTSLPVILFQVPTTAGPIRLQYQGHQVTLPH